MIRKKDLGDICSARPIKVNPSSDLLNSLTPAAVVVLVEPVQSQEKSITAINGLSAVYKKVCHKAILRILRKTPATCFFRAKLLLLSLTLLTNFVLLYQLVY